MSFEEAGAERLALEQWKKYITVAVILKRMSPIVSFSPQLAMICAGVDGAWVCNTSFVESFKAQFDLANKLYGEPCYSPDDKACFQRYQYFVQYAERWPSTQQLSDIQQLALAAITKQNPRAGAIGIVSEDVTFRKGKFYMKCERWDRNEEKSPFVIEVDMNGLKLVKLGRSHLKEGRMIEFDFRIFPQVFTTTRLSLNYTRIIIFRDK